jgi:outer membrane lipoprotein carrier protein
VRIAKTFARFICATLLLAFAATVAPSQNQPPNADRVVQALDSHYRAAKTLQADFLERFSEGGQQERLESGRVYFAKPGRMRWEYESPETKLFVSDGRILWFYVPADRSATRQLVKQSDDWRTPLALLTGRVNLSRLCGRIQLASGPPLSDGSVVLQCWPKSEVAPAARPGQQNASNPLDSGSDFTEVLLEVNPASGELNDVRVQQPGGVELEFRFGAWQMNPPLPGSLFEFEPPAGVAIVPGEGSLDSSP